MATFPLLSAALAILAAALPTGSAGDRATGAAESASPEPAASAAAPGAPAGPAGPAAHMGPPFSFDIEVDGRSIAVKVLAEQELALGWLGLDHPLPDPEGRPRPSRVRFDTPPTPFADDVTARVTAAIRDRLLTENTFTADGTRLEFTVEEVGVPELYSTQSGVPSITFTLKAEVPTPPQTVGIEWHWYEGALYLDRNVIPGFVRRLEDADVSLFSLSPQEPGYTWHAPTLRAPDLPPPPPPPPPGRIPWESIVAAAVGALLLLAGVLRVVPRVVAVVLAGCCGVAAGLLWRTEPVVELPPPDDALEIFDRLHRGIYDAFDARGEEEVYDRLARSVSGDRLETTYLEVQESLILRGEGGAVCTIEDVEMLRKVYEGEGGWDATLLVAPPEGAGDVPEEDEGPAFRVLADWQVRGEVAHWGHRHTRLNRYKARYIVRHDGRGWRIADWEVLDASREDSSDLPEGGSGPSRFDRRREGAGEGAGEGAPGGGGAGAPLRLEGSEERVDPRGAAGEGAGRTLRTEEGGSGGGGSGGGGSTGGGDGGVR